MGVLNKMKMKNDMEKEHNLAKWLDGNMTGSELEAFERSPEFSSYQKIASYSTQLRAPEVDSQEMYRKVIETPKEKAVIAMRPNWLLRIAAILVIGLGLFFATAPMVTSTETAQNGQQQIFELPDNSQVTLNSGSEITYKKWRWDDNRTLELQGEAFFKVAKGKTFDVHTELGTVTVVGTQFNVKSRGKRFEVACFEGKVRVDNGTEKVLLTKGQSVAFDNGQPLEPVACNGQIPSWMNDELTFSAESFESVVAELERQYNIRITTENISVSQKFTGTLPAGNLETALQIISSAYNLKTKKTGKTSVTFYR